MIFQIKLDPKLSDVKKEFRDQAPIYELAYMYFYDQNFRTNIQYRTELDL